MKKFIAILVLICSLFCFTGCGEKIYYVDRPVEIEKIVEVPIEVIKEIEIPVEVIKEIEVEKIVEVEKQIISNCCDSPRISYDTNFIDGVNIRCMYCNTLWGVLPMSILPKEYITEYVEKEIIKIKTVEVEKLVYSADLKIFTWEEVKTLKVGDKVSNALIRNNSFITKITKEKVNPGHTTQWTTGVYDFNVETMESVCKLKINHADLPHPEWGDGIQEDYTTFGNIGIWSGTISEIVWNTDEYGNTTVDIFFFEEGCEMKTFLDFVIE